ncbi:MAG: DsbA family protein [Hyphomicrobium sp.]|nr:DsbA family protein [Hyphomicrobium sp.]
MTGRVRSMTTNTGRGWTGPDGRALLFWLTLAILGGVGLILASGGARAASKSSLQLVMVDDPACHYCRKWQKDVGGGYGRSAEGRLAPLVKIRRGSPRLVGLNPVVYTPTFLLMRGGHEVGRITGYPGQFYFWEELADLLRQAGHEPR